MPCVTLNSLAFSQLVESLCKVPLSGCGNSVDLSGLNDQEFADLFPWLLVKIQQWLCRVFLLASSNFFTCFILYGLLVWIILVQRGIWPSPFYFLHFYKLKFAVFKQDSILLCIYIWLRLFSSNGTINNRKAGNRKTKAESYVLCSPFFCLILSLYRNWTASIVQKYQQ